MSAKLVVHNCCDSLEAALCTLTVRPSILQDAPRTPDLLCLMFAVVVVSVAYFDMQGASGAELKACCTEAGMFALRERRVHVTQEDFEMAVAKVMAKDTDKNTSIKKLWK